MLESEAKQNLPDPLISPLVDFSRDFIMPLSIPHMRGSDFVDGAKGPVLKAALFLWMAAWQQVPCGSLPNNPRQLARFALVTPQWWGSNGGKALTGFILCSDNRYYHPTLCELAEARMARSKRASHAANSRHLKRFGAELAVSGQDASKVDVKNMHLRKPCSPSAQAVPYKRKEKKRYILSKDNNIPPRAREAVPQPLLDYPQNISDNSVPEAPTPNTPTPSMPAPTPKPDPKPEPNVAADSSPEQAQAEASSGGGLPYEGTPTTTPNIPVQNLMKAYVRFIENFWTEENEITVHGPTITSQAEAILAKKTPMQAVAQMRNQLRAMADDNLEPPIDLMFLLDDELPRRQGSPPGNV